MSVVFGVFAILGLLLVVWLATDETTKNPFDGWFFAAVACTLVNLAAFLVLT